MTKEEQTSLRINRKIFFDEVRETLFNGALQQGQVDGMNAILAAWERSYQHADMRWLAYILATAYHETAYTMQPVRETLAATDERAIAILDKAYVDGKLSWVKNPYWRRDDNGQSWLGRGLVQLTHKRNYEAMSALTGLDLVSHPDRAMDMDVAVTILIEGMRLGSFTGHKLADFFSNEREDWVNARRIVNGLDRAEKIAAYGGLFYAALQPEPDVLAQLNPETGIASRLKRWMARVIAAITGRKQPETS